MYGRQAGRHLVLVRFARRDLEHCIKISLYQSITVSKLANTGVKYSETLHFAPCQLALAVKSLATSTKLLDTKRVSTEMGDRSRAHRLGM